jgi:hypothetical protein
MDDLFQYIIYGIIIFSFLSSFFKKKELPKPPLPGTKPKDSIAYPKPPENVNLETAIKKHDEYDILRELENMFKGNLKIPEQPKPKQVDTNDIYQSHEIKDKDLDLVIDKRMQRSVQDQSPIGSRLTYDERKLPVNKLSIDRQKKGRTVDDKIEAGALAFEKVLAGPLKQRTTITEFNRKLKNPSTVREYILFSEILGKPKALRR